MARKRGWSDSDGSDDNRTDPGKKQKTEESDSADEVEAYSAVTTGKGTKQKAEDSQMFFGIHMFLI